MKKIPTLFKRITPDKGKKSLVTNEFNDVQLSQLRATIKWDGTPVMYDGERWYKRFDLKPGRKLPSDAIPCQSHPDNITGHWPHWVPVLLSDPGDNHISQAIYNYTHYYAAQIAMGTYEAIGPGINGNPYNLVEDTLRYHGEKILPDIRINYEYLYTYLSDNAIEGIVFWNYYEPVCKIKRSDFGFEWPPKMGDRKETHHDEMAST